MGLFSKKKLLITALVLVVIILVLLTGGWFVLSKKEAQAPEIPTKEIPEIIAEETHSCSDFISNHNKPEENRINLVLIGFDYTSLEKFKNVAELAIDFRSEGRGLFSLEPFKSNKDKFNIWYVGTVGKSQSRTEDTWELSSICRKKLGVDDHKFTRREHLFSDKMFSIFLMNKGTEASKVYSFNPQNYYCTPELDSGQCGLKGMHISMAEDGTRRATSLHNFVHEFAHTFTFQNFYHEYRPAGYYEILDEYVLFNAPYSSQLDPLNIVPTHSNCFVGTYGECNSKKNTLFGDIIGNGCGKDGVIDCCTNDPNAIKEGARSCDSCIGCQESPDYDLEISCNEGCWAKTGCFRSTFRSLMSSRVGSFSYGKLNESLLCRQIRNLVGDGEGVCKQ